MCPTSVMFITSVTAKPSSSSARRMRSESMYVRKLPRCAVRYTVGPHAYIFTWPGSTGRTSSSSRVSVL